MLNLKGIFEYEKSTVLFYEDNAINTSNYIIISYSTILYHMIIESQLVINVVLILIKMLYKNSIKPYKYCIYTNRYFSRFYVIDKYM